jgi:hypothetical protein
MLLIGCFEVSPSFFAVDQISTCMLRDISEGPSENGKGLLSLVPTNFEQHGYVLLCFSFI